MTKLYIPLGKAVILGENKKRPAVLVGSKIYDNLSYLDMAMYTVMQWHICNEKNLEEYYYRKTLTDHAFAGGRLGECLESLLQKGLIACAESNDDEALLYDLLAWHTVNINIKTIGEYMDDYRLLRRRTSIRVALQVFKRPRLTGVEKKVLDYVNKQVCMYELILAMNKKEPPSNFKQSEALFYLQLVDEQQEYLGAIISLYLKKQIFFV